MPDLNLIDEGEFEESTAPVSAPPPMKKKKSSGGGGSGTTVIILLLVLVIAGAGVYFLNKRGIINIQKLWKKNPPPVTQVQEETLPPEQPVEQQPVAAPQPPKQDSSAEVALLETTPLEDSLQADQTTEAALQNPRAVSVEKRKALKETKEFKEPKAGKAQKTHRIQESDDATEPSARLSDMKGEFTVQVIAYRDNAQATTTAKNLEAAGYPAFVEKVPMKGGDWYTVRIGRYATREDAKHAVKSFAAQLQSNYVIDKIRSK